ncbi:class A beta-lactamase [Verrucomicrobium spinosum]|uniref:class A beta-lactamase n=1 Tax=Verrucomicrobium spinosum TaxID=2736 RepID=UPI000492C51E
MTRSSFCKTLWHLGVAGVVVLRIVTSSAQEPAATLAAAISKLEGVEGSSGARLGVYALDLESGMEVSRRTEERFPVCSTFKVMLTAAILKQSVQDAGLMTRRVSYAKEDLVTYSPVTEKHVEGGMTVEALCAAAMQYSDNTAANLLMKILGGPGAVTAYARSIGDTQFRLDRWETELNTALPGDPRDTSNPAAMGHSLQKLALGDGLPEAQRAKLVEWLQGNTTGDKRIRAAVPPGWKVGDKTGSGDYGTANDIAILWPPGRKPIVLAIYHTQKAADAKWQNEVVAAAARVVLEAFGMLPVKG